ncbi:SagB family peptide dehydrogenase [Bacillus sp. JJ722]|uniref:SagB family peptide dehydrogenase n=1 Tax=Bacillus sp. JJ722 TaxID=3122973 RepID=UPI002FFF7128
MALDTFLHNLHFNVEKLSPPNWEVDWDDAPLPYKLYRGLQTFPFSLEVRLTLEERKVASIPNFHTIGDFLWYVYGLTQYSETIFSLDSTEEIDLFQSFRRFAPSGGALYPNELYVYLKMDDLPNGVYHYDVAHHRLVLLREGNFDSYIGSALGERCDLSSCFGTVFVSTMFWKNYFKYNNFSYRLQGMDTGVLIGQLLEVAKRFGFESAVYFQFLDRAINHLLGLGEEEESTYAVIALSMESACYLSTSNKLDPNVTTGTLCRELPSIQHNHYMRSLRVKEFPMLVSMNDASKIESTQSFKRINMNENILGNGHRIDLPHTSRLSYDLSLACRNRFSPEMDFTLGKVSKEDLSAIMHEATASFLYRNDLDSLPINQNSRVSLYGCLYNIEDITAGAYQYDNVAHALKEIQLGDQRLHLQYGLSLDNVNMQQIPLCLHVVGDLNHYKEALGYRGYRIQQMEAGMLVQRLLIAASALGMGGHPLLGYNVKLCDDLYQLKKETCLIQIPIGYYRNRAWLKGSLRS